MIKDFIIMVLLTLFGISISIIFDIIAETNYKIKLQQQQITVIKHEKDSIRILLRTSDSLRASHAKECSFISIEQLYVNKNGFLKIKRPTHYAK